MGWTVLYIAFGIVALWLLGEVLLQYKARLRWRLLAFVGFLGVVLGVLIPSVIVIGLGAAAFAVGQTYVTLSFRRGFAAGWAVSGLGRRPPGRAASAAAVRTARTRRWRSPTSTATEAGTTSTGHATTTTRTTYDRDDPSSRPAPDDHGRRVDLRLRAAAPAGRHRLVRRLQRRRLRRRRPATRPPARPRTRTDAPARATATTATPATTSSSTATTTGQQQYAAYSDPYIGTQTYGGAVVRPAYGGAAAVRPAGLHPGPVRHRRLRRRDPGRRGLGAAAAHRRRPVRRRTPAGAAVSVPGRTASSGNGHRAAGTTSSTGSDEPVREYRASPAAARRALTASPGTPAPPRSARPPARPTCPRAAARRRGATSRRPRTGPVRACCWRVQQRAVRRRPARARDRAARRPRSPRAMSTGRADLAPQQALAQARAPPARRRRPCGPRASAAPVGGPVVRARDGTVAVSTASWSVVRAQRRVVRARRPHTVGRSRRSPAPKTVQLVLPVRRVHHRAVRGVPARARRAARGSTTAWPRTGAPGVRLESPRPVQRRRPGQAVQQRRRAAADDEVRLADRPVGQLHARRPAVLLQRPRRPRRRRGTRPCGPRTARTPPAPTPACRRAHTRCRRRAPCTAARPRSPGRRADRGRTRARGSPGGRRAAGRASSQAPTSARVPARRVRSSRLCGTAG